MGSLTNIIRYIPRTIQLNSPQINTHHITTKIGPQNYIIPTQSLTSFGLWAKPKESPKFQKSHYDVANSKARYDAALFTKPIATRQYFTKSQNHFY